MADLLRQLIPNFLLEVVTNLFSSIFGFALPTRSMTLRAVFTAATSQLVVHQRLRWFFIDAAYTLEQNGSSDYSYRRWSEVSPYQRMTPRHWEATVRVILRQPGDAQTRVAVIFCIDTSAQHVLKRERHYWDTELNTFVDYVKDGAYGLQNLTRAERYAHIQNWSLRIIPFVLVFPCWILSIVLLMRVADYMSALGSLVAFIIWIVVFTLLLPHLVLRVIIRTFSLA